MLFYHECLCQQEWHMQGKTAARCATEARKPNAAEVLEKCAPKVRRSRAASSGRPRQAVPDTTTPPTRNTTPASQIHKAIVLKAVSIDLASIAVLSILPALLWSHKHYLWHVAQIIAAAEQSVFEQKMPLLKPTATIPACCFHIERPTIMQLWFITHCTFISHYRSACRLT